MGNGILMVVNFNHSDLSGDALRIKCCADALERRYAVRAACEVEYLDRHRVLNAPIAAAPRTLNLHVSATEEMHPSRSRR